MARPEARSLAMDGVPGFAQPKVPDHLLGVWDAFKFLCHAREIGAFGPGRITLQQIDLYMTHVLGGLSGYRWESFARKILVMDAAFLAKLNEKKDGG